MLGVNAEVERYVSDVSKTMSVIYDGAFFVKIING